MSSLVEDLDGVQELEFCAGYFVGLRHTVTTRPVPAGMPEVTITAGPEDRFMFPLPSAAVARKLSEQFARLAEQMGYPEPNPYRTFDDDLGEVEGVVF